jgi:hypothetical protein
MNRPLEDLCIDGRILKWTFLEWDCMGWIHLIQDRNKRWNLASMDHGNAPSDLNNAGLYYME